MTILLSDPRVAAVPVHDNGERLVRLPRSFGPARALVRSGLAERLALAQADLPGSLSLRVVEGHRPLADQRAIIARYEQEVRAAHPHADAVEFYGLVSRFVAPVGVAPHVAGAAVDLTLTDHGRELDLGTPIDTTPEQSANHCYFASPDISATARRYRDVLARALRGVGLVNYPTEWWHWSYGDRYWALTTGAPAALYGPLDQRAAA